MADALAFGGACIALLNHADRVKVACLAQLVNAIAPIMTETGGAAWRQTIFHPFADVARRARGTVLRVEPVSPRYETTRYGDVPLVDATCTWDEESDELTIALVRSSNQRSRYARSCGLCAPPASQATQPGLPARRPRAAIRSDCPFHGSSRLAWRITASPSPAPRSRRARARTPARSAIAGGATG